MAVFDPLFGLAARVLSFFYSLWPSYAGAIVLLTVCVMILLTPLTVRSTKSMLAARKLHPQVKRLQAEFRHDRQRLNEEMMALYREHKVNPLGGCLPLLMQSPIFIVLFQLLRGLTRRTSSLGHHVAASSVCSTGGLSGGEILCEPSDIVSVPKLTLNPDYLDPGTELYKDLADSTEMRSWGLDLAESASSAIGASFVSGLPYIGSILLVAVLGYYQQRQISGRTSDVSQPPQARLMMKIIPIILPLISLTLPAGLVVYYIAQSIIRIGQQSYITRKVYKPAAEADEAEQADDVKEQSKELPSEPEKAQGLAGMFGFSKQPDPYRHGRERPVSGPAPKPKPKPPAARAEAAARPANPSANARKNPSTKGKKSPEVASGKRASRRRKKRNEPPPKPPSSRVTPKGAQQHRSKRRRK